jgi:ribose transport system ATP-binding protein
MAPVPLLQMQGISKRFPGVVALDRVAFEADAGNIVALVGENGAGKSTLMKILAGLHRPDAGEIRIGDRVVSMDGPVDAARLGIAVIHQELEVIDNLDVAGNVFLGREPTRGGPLRLVDRRRLYADTQRYLDRLGLDVSPQTQASRLSTAQQQMVAIARALSMNARILIMDEPTSSLTLDDTERLFRVLHDLRASGTTIVYISHRLSEIETLADRVVVLRDGKNAGELARAEIERTRMVRLMVGRNIAADAAGRRAADGEVCLRVEGLRTARYPAVEVSFEVRRGEVLGIAGLIGAGRTELAEALVGVARRVAGRIVLDGRKLTIASPRDALGHGICLIPEDRRRYGLITTLGIRDNIVLPMLPRYARLGLIARSREATAARASASRLQVKAPSIETRVDTLSGGNQQKVVLAKWLTLDPRVIVFDEPTRGIDVGAKAEIYRLMRELAESGTAIVMISSDMEEILANSDRVAVMHEGRVTGVLDRDACTPESIMRLAVA